MSEDWETPCLKREDGIHCNCWYDGNGCCACGDPAILLDDEGQPILDQSGNVIPRDPRFATVTPQTVGA